MEVELPGQGCDCVNLAGRATDAGETAGAGGTDGSGETGDTADPGNTWGPGGTGGPGDTGGHGGPDSTAAYLTSRLDEVHAEVLAAKHRRSPARDPAGLIEVEDSETFAELVDLAKAWIHWLLDAAGDGDAAARAHLRDLGFDGPLTQTEDGTGAGASAGAAETPSRTRSGSRSSEKPSRPRRKPDTTRPAPRPNGARPLD
jgi:hypothetical protein